MTEDEAKTKLCHQSLAAIHCPSGGAFFNPSTCIGSACMAWRWTSETPAKETVSNDDLPRWKVAGWSVEIAGEKSSLLTRPPSGFCGLAGRPA